MRAKSVKGSAGFKRNSVLRKELVIKFELFFQTIKTLIKCKMKHTFLLFSFAMTL